MIDTNVMTIVQNCLDSGVILALLDRDKLSIKGNKKAPAVDELRALVATNRRAVLTAVETVTMQRAANSGWNEQVKQQAKPVLTPFEVAPAPVALTSDNFQFDFTVAGVEELPIETAEPMRETSKQQPPTVPTHGDMLIIRDAEPFTFEFDPDPAPIEANDACPAPLPPIRWHTSNPALPVELWVTGATSADAWAAFQALKQTYFCAWGHDGRAIL